MGGHLILFFIVCLSMYCKTSSEKFCNFFRWNYQFFFFFETLPINIVNIILYFRPVRSNLLYYQLILLIGNLKSSLCANKILYRSQYISMYIYIYIYFFFFFLKIPVHCHITRLHDSCVAWLTTHAFLSFQIFRQFFVRIYKY